MKAIVQFSIWSVVTVLTALADVSPEASPLFRRVEDLGSGVASYVLRSGLVAESQQSLYFTQKSMTDDGRFLIFNAVDNEFKNHDGSPRGDKGPRPDAIRSARVTVLDLETQAILELEGVRMSNVYLDVARDALYYLKYDSRTPASGYVAKRELKIAPKKEIRLCGLPNLSGEGVLAGPIHYYCTHLTISGDRRFAFLDSFVGDGFIQGLLELSTGTFIKWGETPFRLNHGQINPCRNDLALGAWECVPWKDSKGIEHGIQFENGVYPRLQLLSSKGRRTIPAVETNYASHECWDVQGEGFYWCASGVFYHDLKSGRQMKLAPIGSHPSLSQNRQYVVVDVNLGAHYRGCPWRVYFHNRGTGKGVFVETCQEALCPDRKGQVSRLHPDPHPVFVANDRYVVYTKNNRDGHMDVAVVATTQLVARTTGAHMVDWSMSAGFSPKTIAQNATDRFLEERPWQVATNGIPVELDHVPGWKSIAWVDALGAMSALGDSNRLERLRRHFLPLLGEELWRRNLPVSLEQAVLGIVPLELARTMPENAYQFWECGYRYALGMWMSPDLSCDGWATYVNTIQDDWRKVWPVKFSESAFCAIAQQPSYEEQLALFRDGRSVLEHGRADELLPLVLLARHSGMVRRTAWRSVAASVSILQEKDGPMKGLFHACANSPIGASRTQSSVLRALGLLVARANSRAFSLHNGRLDDVRVVLSAYRELIRALIERQRESGGWGAVIEDSASSTDYSATAEIAAELIWGIRNGWLDVETYGAIAESASRLVQKASVEGTSMDLSSLLRFTSVMLARSQDDEPTEGLPSVRALSMTLMPQKWTPSGVWTNAEGRIVRSYSQSFSFSSSRGPTLLLCDHIGADAVFRLNGVEIGRVRASSPVSVDMSSVVKIGQNSLQVDLEERNGEKVGLFFPMTIGSYPRNHLVPGTLRLSTSWPAEDRAEVNVSYQTFSGVSTNFCFPVMTPELWTPNRPRRYKLRLPYDAYLYSLGIKKLEFKHDTDVWLNGEKFEIRGVCLENCRGYFRRPWNEKKVMDQFLLLKKAGCNAICLKGQPLHYEFVHAICEKMGFLVWAELSEAGSFSRTDGEAMGGGARLGGPCPKSETRVSFVGNGRMIAQRTELRLV